MVMTKCYRVFFKDPYGHNITIDRFYDQKEANDYKQTLSRVLYPCLYVEPEIITIFNSKEEALNRDLEKEKEVALNKLTKREKEILGLK
jgi:hypothetical protein